MKYSAFHLMLLLLLISTTTMAATTGKIAGTIKDAATDDPLPGVNIVLKGTMMGAATNLQGEYFIINVPPGNYILLVTYMGYITENISNVKVNIDRSTRLDIKMKSTVLEAGDEVVVVAERERIRTDVSYSQQSISAEEIMSIPTGQDLRETIALGVGIDRDLYGHISIRGGELDEVGFFVDDYSMNDRRLGITPTNIPKAAIQEIQILTGGFTAEYGQARSGMINVVTKNGSSKFSGSLDYRISPNEQGYFGPDYMSPGNWWEVGRFLTMEPSEDRDNDGNPDFEGWNHYFARNPSAKAPNGQKIHSGQEAMDIWAWHHRPQSHNEHQDHYVEGTFGGPVPFTGDNVSFFYSGYFDYLQFPFRFARPVFTDRHNDLKLRYQLSKNIRLGLKGSYGDTRSVTYDAEPESFVDSHYWNNVAGAMDDVNTSEMYSTDSRMMESSTWRSTAGIDMNHVLNKNSFYEIRLNYDRSRYRIHPGELRDSSIVKVVGEVELDESPIGFAADKVLDQLSIGRLAEDKGWRDYSWYETYSLTADYTNQLNSNHQIKAGLAGALNKMYLHYGRDRWRDNMTRRFEQWTNRDIDYIEAAAYLQDKIEFEGMILNVGLRADVFNNNEPVFTDPWSEYYMKTINYDSLYFAPMKSAKPKIMLSPRIGISHPISETSKLFFNYGYFYQRGQVDQLFRNEQAPTKPLQVMGNPDLYFRKTISYELGVEQEILNGLFTYTLTGYYKDVSGEISNIDYIGIDEDIEYERAMNNGYKDIRGFEVEIKLKRFHYFSGWLNYEYQISSSGRYGWQVVYEDAWQKNELQPEDQTKPRPRPRIRANLQLTLPRDKKPSLMKMLYSDLTISGIIQWRAGEWITYPETNPKRDNLQWKPWYNIDLNVSKGFGLFGRRIFVYAEVHNLLNTKFLTSSSGLWGSGATEDDREGYLDLIDKLGLKPGEYNHPELKKYIEKQHYYLLYGPTRNVWFGFRFEF